TKDLMLPLIVARPWPNGKHLMRTWEKVAEALGERPFAVDLDRERFGQTSPRPANAEFNALFDESNAYANYYNQVAALPFAIPVLRLNPSGVKNLQGQLAHIDRLDRGGFVVRIEHGFPQNSISTLEAILELRQDFVLFLDAGWLRDLLSREVWA